MYPEVIERELAEQHTRREEVRKIRLAAMWVKAPGERKTAWITFDGTESAIANKAETEAIRLGVISEGTG